MVFRQITGQERSAKIAGPVQRQDKTVEEFAAHMAADAKVLDEDDETGIKRYRYVRTGENHFSLAFTYAWMAAMDWSGHRGLLEWMRQRAKGQREETRGPGGVR